MRTIITLSCCLGLAVVLLVVAGYRLVTAESRCKATIADKQREAVEAERERVEKDDAAAVKLFANVRHDVQSDQRAAHEKVESRAERIVKVRVTGACAMPKGLPDLSDAVKEARDAAAD